MMTRIIRGTGLGLIAGVVILGLGGRLLMSAIALVGRHQSAWSLGGTLEVLVLGGLIGLLSGALWTSLLSVIRGYTAVNGAIFGALVFLVVAVWPGDAKNAVFGFPELLPVTVGSFAALFILYGVVLAMAWGRIQAR